MECVLAIDLGTSGPKVALVAESGAVLESEYEPTQLILPPTESFGAAAAATELLGASPDPANAPTSALDALFGESRFREYEPGADDSESPFNRAPKDEAKPGKSGGVGTAQKVLLWVAAGLVGVIALVALFLVGTRLPELFGPAPVVSNGAQIASLDPTTFAQADRTLMDFTGGVSSLIRGRLGGDTLSGNAVQVTGYAPESAGERNPRLIGKTPTASPVSATTIWASSFGGASGRRSGR